MSKVFKTLSAAALAASFPLAQAQTPMPATAPVAEARWVCTAQNLVSARYTGGDWANVHLSPYASGGSYKIMEKTELVAKGVTRDGTPFECKKIS